MRAGGGAYEPVWRPDRERTTLDLQASGIALDRLVHRLYAGLQLARRAGVQRPRLSGAYARRHAVSRALFRGLPWLHTWGSGRFSGIARDAEHIVKTICSTREARAVSVDALTA